MRTSYAHYDQNQNSHSQPSTTTNQSGSSSLHHLQLLIDQLDPSRFIPTNRAFLPERQIQSNTFPEVRQNTPIITRSTRGRMPASAFSAYVSPPPTYVSLRGRHTFRLPQNQEQRDALDGSSSIVHDRGREQRGALNHPSSSAASAVAEICLSDDLLLDPDGVDQ